MAGTNLTDDVQSGGAVVQGGNVSAIITAPGARRLILGLKAEYQLPRHWAIEFNALHREWKSSTTTLYSPPLELPDGRTISMLGPVTRTLTTWEFPILAKYRFPLRKVQPLFEAGPSLRPAGTGSQLSHAGITLGGGVDFQLSGFRMSPTLRYTRWSSANAGNFAAPRVNQVEVLFGFDRPVTTSGASAFGRRLSIGAVVGIGFGKDFVTAAANPGQTSEANSRIYGVMMEVPIAGAWAAEVDGLYRPLHGSDLEFGRQVRFAHLTWEFPLLVKYRFSINSRLAWIAEAGASFRAEGNVNLQSVSHYGVTVGAGVERKFGRLKISPRIRYVRWAGELSGSLAHTWADETQLLLSLSF